MAIELNFNQTGYLYSCEFVHDNPAIPHVTFCVDIGRDEYFQISASDKLSGADILQLNEVILAAQEFQFALTTERMNLPTIQGFDRHWQQLKMDNANFARLSNQIDDEEDTTDDELG